jgi:hypothetical protein
MLTHRDRAPRSALVSANARQGLARQGRLVSSAFWRTECQDIAPGSCDTRLRFQSSEPRSLTNRCEQRDRAPAVSNDQRCSRRNLAQVNTGVLPELADPDRRHVLHVAHKPVC